MKLLIYSLFFCCLQAVLPLKAQSAAGFFVRVHPERETLYVGDSMLVSVVIYSTDPISKATTKDKLEIKGNCSIRRIPINREASAGRIREGGKLFHTLVWAQYMVAPAKKGRYEIKSMKFKANLQHVVSMPDWFDQMMGAQPEYRYYKAEGSSEVFKFEVKEKPLRNTREMMKSGRVL